MAAGGDDATADGTRDFQLPRSAKWFKGLWQTSLRSSHRTIRKDYCKDVAHYCKDVAKKMKKSVKVNEECTSIKYHMN
jgi:hypothetical protein